jgi:hypothetical protein
MRLTPPDHTEENDLFATTMLYAAALKSAGLGGATQNQIQEIVMEALKSDTRPPEVDDVLWRFLKDALARNVPLNWLTGRALTLALIKERQVTQTAIDTDTTREKVLRNLLEKTAAPSPKPGEQEDPLGDFAQNYQEVLQQTGMLDAPYYRLQEIAVLAMTEKNRPANVPQELWEFFQLTDTYSDQPVAWLTGTALNHLRKPPLYEGVLHAVNEMFREMQELGEEPEDVF